MSARENLTALASYVGKDAPVARMTAARNEYATDNKIRPAEFMVEGKMESAKAIIYHGGYISHVYGISPEAVVKGSNVIAKKWHLLDPLYALPKEEFHAAFAALELDLATEVADTLAMNALLGKTNEKYVKTAKSALTSITFGSVLSPIARLELETIVRHAQAILDYVAPVVTKVSPALAIVQEVVNA